MISLLKKVHIHPVFWGILGIGGLTGYFKEIIMLFLIVFVHELGHSYAAYRFGWRIRKIMLLPFGGMAETEEYGNRPVKEEIIVTISGPLQHLWLIGASYLLLATPLWNEGDHQVFLFHNLTILLFNLLPVLPLDGGKLLFSIQSWLLPFHQAVRISFYFSALLLSAITIISLFILPFHLNLIIVVLFLWVHHYLEWKQRHFLFLRFLLERKRKAGFKGEKQVKVSPATTVTEAIKKVNRERYHYFTLGKNYGVIEEQEILNAFFDEKKRLLPLMKIL
ncbi:M50 family metallopeptidase [Evansella clarkii]|uniref:M50 family metallopeptidase n=1 Tax=Evansella clarkii TaxID=79879 RepID=UPI00099730AE|nr:M50 family metallopeptidase [Evansella clarkii]